MKVKSVRTLIAAAIVLALATAVSAQTIPAGAVVKVRINQTLDSGKNTAGQTFDGVLASDLISGGTTYAKAGAPVQGKIVSVKDSGRLKTPGSLGLRLTSVDGKAVSTAAIYRKGKSHTKSNATKIGGGAAAGALIGALAGGGKGAAIGAGVGAGAGTGVAYATGKQQAVIPAESLLSFTVTAGGSTASKK